MNKFKRAFITGGAQRIGSSITKFLANRGIDVAIQYNNSKNKVSALEKIIKKTGVKFSSFKSDFNKNENFESFFKKINNEFGKIDLLVNNASAFEFDTIKESNYQIFDKHINVNIKAPFFLCQNFIKQLDYKQGLIINIIDQRVKNITPYFSSYTLSKSALYTMTKSLATLVAPKIRVNGISPGPTLKSTNQTDKQFLSQIARTPLKRQVELDEINLAIEYLIKNKSVTGDVLTIDSGQSLGWAHSKSKVFSTD